MESPRVVRLLCALGIATVAVAAPAAARAQSRAAPDTTRPAAVRPVTEDSRVSKGPRPPGRVDIAAARRAGRKNGAGASAAPAAPIARPQAPPKVKPPVT
jgi:hypothetical protein